MFSGTQLRPPVDQSGINVFRLHREPMDARFLMELPGRGDDQSESYIVELTELSWWMDRMLALWDVTSHHRATRRNKIVDYATEFHHVEYEFSTDTMRPLPNWPEPEPSEVRLFEINQKIEYEYGENAEAIGRPVR